MERTIMKLSLATLAGLMLLPAALNSAGINLEKDPIYLKMKAQIAKLTWIEEIKPNQLPADVFIQAMATNIKKGIFEVVEAVRFYDTPIQTWTQKVDYTQKLKGDLQTLILNPLMAEIPLYPAGSSVATILTLIHKIMSDLHPRFAKVAQIFYDHRYTWGAPTDALRLAKALKDNMPTLVSQASLNALENDLKALEHLLQNNGFALIAQDISDLIALIGRAKGSITGKLSQEEESLLLKNILRQVKKL